MFWMMLRPIVAINPRHRASAASERERERERERDHTSIYPFRMHVRDVGSRFSEAEAARRQCRLPALRRNLHVGACICLSRMPWLPPSVPIAQPLLHHTQSGRARSGLTRWSALAARPEAHCLTRRRFGSEQAFACYLAPIKQHAPSPARTTSPSFAKRPRALRKRDHAGFQKNVLVRRQWYKACSCRNVPRVSPWVRQWIARSARRRCPKAVSSAPIVVPTYHAYALHVGILTKRIQIFVLTVVHR